MNYIVKLMWVVEYYGLEKLSGWRSSDFSKRVRGVGKYRAEFSLDENNKIFLPIYLHKDRS
jgi:hypothetical protein